MPETVVITDVTLRDGLQEQDVVLSTDAKLGIADLLVAAGYRELELTSFMRPAWVPQLADAEDLVARFGRRPGIARQVLVPNRRGLERALSTEAEMISFVISASTAHNEENLNRTTTESLREIKDLARLAREAGRTLHGGVATAFGCSIQGEVSDDEVFAVVDAYIEAGVEEVELADTVGLATEGPFARRLETVIRRVGDPARLGLHLHDPGHGVRHLVAIALDLGIRHFDCALAGLGGCPFAPGAPGNAKAEEVVPEVEARGFSTGIDVRRLPEIALALGREIGRATPAPARAHRI